MYQTVYFIHTWWAYLVVLVLLVATINSLMGFFSKKEYGNNDFRISLFALIVTHLQLLSDERLHFAVIPRGAPSNDAYCGNSDHCGIFKTQEEADLECQVQDAGYFLYPGNSIRTFQDSLVCVV